MLKVLVFLAIVSLIRSVPAPQDPNPMHGNKQILYYIDAYSIMIEIFSIFSWSF